MQLRDASGARVFLGDGAEPVDDWTERVRALHEKGYAAVGGAVEPERSLLRRGNPEPRRTRRAAGGIRASRIRSSARRCYRRSSRTARSPVCLRSCRTATSRRCSTAGSCSDFDRDLIVYAAEDERAERKRQHGRDDDVERVAPVRQRAEEERCTDRLDTGESGFSQWMDDTRSGAPRGSPVSG